MLLLTKYTYSPIFLLSVYRHQTISSLKAKPSFRALTWANDVFGKCLSPNTCDLEKYTNNSGCRPGHNSNTSELCAQCIVGWAATTRTEVCSECPDRATTIFLFCMAVLFVVGLFTYLVADSIDGAKEMIETKESMPFHSISIRIVSSYLQVAGMLMSFDLTLPASVRGLIMVEASTSSLSEQFLHFDCLTDLRGDGEMFVIKQLTSVWIIPFVSVLFCGLFWLIYSAITCCSKSSTKTKCMDGFVSSLMVLFYTVFPSVLSRLALSLSCRIYGSKQLLTEALSVTCWQGAHLTVVSLVAIPGILMYAIFIPIMLAKILYTARVNNTLYPTQSDYNAQYTIRYGFLFAGYRENFEWYESAVMLRKCAFVMLSIFLRPYGAAAQVVAVSMVLFLALSSHLHFRPYMHEGTLFDFVNFILT